MLNFTEQMMTDISQRILKETDLLVNDAPHYWENLIPDPSVYCTWKDVEWTLNNSAQYNFEVIDPAGSKIEVPAYNKSWGKFNVQDKKFLFDKLHEGYGLINMDYGFYSEKTMELLAMFESMYSINAAIHVYFGLKDAKSFNIHEDYPANFIIQVEGETRWKIFNNRITYMHRTGLLANKLQEKDLELSLDVTLKPGDVLYIPSRMYHCAYPQGKRLSMSIPCWQKLPTEPEEASIDRRMYRIEDV